MARRGLMVGVIAWLVVASDADMYDVVEAHKVPPSTCKNGCASWSSLGAAAASLFDGGAAAAAAAGTWCAQPGKSVNSYTLGAWCYCENETESRSSAAAPADPTHPLDGHTYNMFDIQNSLDMWVSFAFTAAPPGESGADSWMRAYYPDQKDAMPLKFDAVVGAPHTYLLYNEWPSYQKYVSADIQHGGWLSAHADRAHATPFEFIPAGQGVGDGEYSMVNRASDGGNGMYVSVCGSTCSNLRWLKTSSTNASNAMVVKLVPTGPPVNNSWGYCTSAPGVPEQINVQIGGEPTSVVLSFVTFEVSPPVGPSLARMGTVNGSFTDQHHGITTTHVTSAGDRTYYMHFVRVIDLTPRQRYFYQVKSGSAESPWSDVFSFRAGYASDSPGSTKIDLWGDLGVYDWNAMGNVYKDCAAGDAADLLIHMGDHAYNEGESDELRGDAYMNAWQPATANCPWMPIVGNHEFYDGAELQRFLSQTWGGRDWPVNHSSGRSTATRAVGALLSRGTQHGLGVHGATPSNTSRFFSADFGLVHLIALDLNVYYGNDPCGDPCRKAQLAWLEADLMAANKNRDSVPWVVAMSHYPFYCTGCYAKQMDSAWYESNDAEFYGIHNTTAANRFARAASTLDTKSDNRTLRAGSDASIKDLMPLLTAGNVDVYAAGHWHYYESLWPSEAGTTGTGGKVLQKNFINPNVPVHITTGNGGPPGADRFNEDCPGPDCSSIPSTRFQSTAFGYGRLTAYNSSHLQFQQFANSNSSQIDEFFIVQQGRK